MKTVGLDRETNRGKERTLFSYSPGRDVVRNYDPRLKLPLLLFWLSGLAFAPPLFYPFLLIAPVGAMIAAKISPLAILRESKLFIFLSGALFLSGWINESIFHGMDSAFRFLL